MDTFPSFGPDVFRAQVADMRRRNRHRARLRLARDAARARRAAENRD